MKMADDDKKPVREDRFTSEEGEFIVIDGPGRGKVLGASDGAEPSEGQKALLEHSSVRS